MLTNALVLFIALGLLMSFTAATTMYRDHDFEINAENASAFLHPTSAGGDVHLDKRELGKNCVPCKLGINPCCEPNICIKKTFWFDECTEVKVPQPIFP